MNPLFVALLALALVAAQGSPHNENPVLQRLLSSGVAMPGGAKVPLPPAILPDGLSGEAQLAALAKLVAERYTIEEFTRNAPVAPYLLEIRSIPSAGSESPARGVDVAFVAYGDWTTVTSQTFLESVTKGASPKSKEGEVSEWGQLSSAELRQRKIAAEMRPGQEEVYFFGTLDLFDRVRISSTWQGLLSKSADSYVFAAAIAPHFVHDPQHPDQWRPITLDDAGVAQLGPPHPYDRAGFYGKITRLTGLKGALFFEYHLVFDEPEGWFGGANLLRSKLPLIMQDQIRSFRRKLAAAPPAAR